MSSPRVLLLVTGGIAAYKACFLARLLTQAGFSVKVAMTEAATRFVGPVSFQTLTGHPVATDLWGDGPSEALDHIEYARWADIAVVAPATANTLGKMAQGIGDDIVSTLLLAFPGPLLVAPAMNDQMWANPAVQGNMAALKARGVHTVGPAEGWLACGTVSGGRMSEPEEIVPEVVRLAAGLKGLRPDQHPLSEEMATPAGGYWQGRDVVITAGPTHEAIDPVRYVANRSSGQMGYALAAAALQGGAKVHLISGPTNLVAPRGLAGFSSVESAQEMASAVKVALDQTPDWLIMSAAVADYTPVEPAVGKIKKEGLGDRWSLEMIANPDILADVVPAHRGDSLKVVGFALETDDVEARAARKREAKQMDYIVANNPVADGSGFGAVDHQVMLMDGRGVLWRSESLPKRELAMEILRRLAAGERERRG